MIPSLRQPFSVRVPATSANLGAGFDSIGLALTLYNDVDVLALREPGDYALEILGEGARELADPEANLVVRTYERICRAGGVEPPGLVLRNRNAIPLARGLGSSAAAVVAGALIAQRVCALPVSDEDLLKAMVEIEGHPDNAVPCRLGGMAVSCWDGSELRTVRLSPPPYDIAVVVAVPEVRVQTEAARKALPEQVGLKDAVFNLSRAALFAAAWSTGRWEHLRWGMDDRLHQPYRSRLFPGGTVVMDRAKAVPECLGVAISGSGPSILAFVKGRPRRTAEAICGTFSEYGVKSRFFVLEGDPVGAVIRPLSADPGEARGA
jgi:homoserine kinase